MVQHLLPAVAAIVAVLIANGLTWSTSRRRTSLMRELAEVLRLLPDDHPARSRLSDELDRESIRLVEYSDRADRRFLATMFFVSLIAGYALVYGAQVYNHYVLDRPIEQADEYLEQGGLILTIFGLAGVGLAVVAASALAYANSRLWISSRRAASKRS